MKAGENPLYTMMASYLELATEVVLEPTSPFTGVIKGHDEIGRVVTAKVDF